MSGLNVRFDIYKGAMSGNRNKPGYPPAPNVTKGYEISGQCTAPPADPDDPTYSALPKDACFETNSCPDYFGVSEPGDEYDGRIGDGQWGEDAAFRYFKANHPQLLADHGRSEEHTSELQSLMRISYAVF